ncbi:MAG: hypothetical protein R3F59_34160 [Myxococcota bacterium]
MTDVRVVEAEADEGYAVWVDDTVVFETPEADAARKVSDWAAWSTTHGLGVRTVLRHLRGQPAEVDPNGVLVAQATGLAALLDGTVPEIAARLEAGDGDVGLGELLEAEALGKARKGVLGALRDRQAAVALRAVLAQPVAALAEALATGAHDAELEALDRAEAGGRDRKGAREALAERRARRDVLAVLDGTIDDLRALLDSGRAEGHREALRAAEAAGKARKGALALLS